MSLALVYLSRGVDGGISSAREFFEAYEKYPTSCDHELIVISKGWLGIDGYDELEALARRYSARIFRLPDDGYDWGAYMRLVPQLDHDLLCFLNTHSRPRVDGWLKILKDAAKSLGKEFGAVGSTGSWESLAPIKPMFSRNSVIGSYIMYPIRFIVNAIRLPFNVKSFPIFPNPHLRSNAFIVSRGVFSEFLSTSGLPCTKRDAVILESGRKGFSNFITSRGLKITIAGADGKIYTPQEWMNSGAFRVPGQTNLLVEDNQTIAYELASPYVKQKLEKLAWGIAVSSVVVDRKNC